MITLPQTSRHSKIWRLLALLVIVVALALPATAEAQRKKRKRRSGKNRSAQVDKKTGAKVFDFTGMSLGGRMRTPQLMYFLDRAEQELDRATLEKRSFIPEMARSMEEERL